MTNSVSVVIPVFNSASTLSRLTCELLEVGGPGIEIIFVDDGSTDTSWVEIVKLSQTTANVRGLSLGRNFGQHNAVLAGLLEARGDVVVTMDDDLQHPPSDVPNLLAALDDDVDVVYGVAIQPNHPRLRNAASGGFKALLRVVSGVDFRGISDFRVIRQHVIQGLRDQKGPRINLDALLGNLTSATRTVGIAHAPRGEGRSTYSLAGLLGYAATMAVEFTLMPLRLSWSLSVLSFLGAAAVLFLDAPLGVIADASSVLVALLLIGGVQLVALGFIGEYLGRTFAAAQGRPAFHVRLRTPNGDTPDGDPPNVADRRRA